VVRDRWADPKGGTFGRNVYSEPPVEPTMAAMSAHHEVDPIAHGSYLRPPRSTPHRSLSSPTAGRVLPTSVSGASA